MTAQPDPGPARGPFVSRSRLAYERMIAVDRAGAEIQDYLWRFQEEHELTSAEMLLILTHAEKGLLENLLGRRPLGS